MFLYPAFKMKFFLVAVCLAVAVAAEAGTDSALWESFKLTHKKSYSKIEEVHRFNVFQQNLRKIEEHNKKYDAGEKTYTMGVNQFADMSTEEFGQFLNMQMRPKLNSTFPRTRYVKKIGADLPASIDWRKKNAVTEVKNQGQCGGCWAFSTNGALEGAYALTFNKLISFSEQQLLDCANDTYAMAGCRGGILEFSYKYMYDYGMESEADYPYEAEQHTCRYSSSKVVPNTHIPLVIYVDNYDEEALLQSVGTDGPVSVTVSATLIHLYKSGIFSENGCKRQPINHAMLIVGYDTEDGVDYWIVKNSWGTTFGEEGYIRMKRGGDTDMCNINSSPSYPKFKNS